MYYSPWKAVHQRDKLNALKRGERISPVLVKIILTNFCNRSCHFCWETEANRRFKATLNTDIVTKLLLDFKEMGGQAVELAGGGEPTMHPDFNVIVELIHELGLELGMPTNGIKLNPKTIDNISFATWVRVSVNAYSRRVYKDIGKTSPPDDDIYRLLCSKVSGEVGASFVITERNYKEILDFALWAKEIGFDHVRYTPFRVENGISPTLYEIWPICEELMAEAEKIGDENFTVLTNRNRYVATEGMVQPIKFLDTTIKEFKHCHIQQFNACVWTTGEVFPCVENRLNRETSYGNLHDSSFKDIWNARVVLPVEKCPLPCLYYNTNVFLDYLTTPEPTHVNFV